MATKARVAITAENNMSKGLLESKKAMIEWQQSVQKIGKAISTAFNAGAIVLAFKGISNAVGSCVTDFTAADRKYRQLALTLGNGKAFQQASATISKLNKITLTSKDEIESMVSQLAALGKSSEEIDKISSAAVALSNVTGKDLNSSMTTLLNTYKGTTTQLNRLGVQTAQFTKEQLASGAAIELVNEKFGKLSEEMAKGDFSQAWKNIKDNLGDMKQGLGDLITYSFGDLVQKASEFSEVLNSGFNEFVQNIKVVAPAIPQIFAKLGETIGNMLKKLFTAEGVLGFFNMIYEYVLVCIRNTISQIINAGDALVAISKEVLKGLGNYLMYWVSWACDKIGLNVADLFNTISSWLTGSSFGQAINTIVSGVVNSIRLIRNELSALPRYLEAFFTYLSKGSENAFSDLLNYWKTIIGNVAEILGNLITKINIGQMIENIKTEFDNLFGRINIWLSVATRNVKEFFRYVFASIASFVTDGAVGKFFSKVSIWLSTLGANIAEVFRYTKDVIAAIFSGNTFKNFFENIQIAVSNMASSFKEAFRFISDTLKATFSSANLTNIFKNLGVWAETIRDNFKNMFVYIGEVMKAIFSWDNIKSVAVHMVESFLNFFVDKVNALIEKLPKVLKVDTIERVSFSNEKYQSPLSKLSAPGWQSAKDKTTAYNPYANVSAYNPTQKAYIDVVAEATKNVKDLSLATADYTAVVNKEKEAVAKPNYFMTPAFVEKVADTVTSTLGDTISKFGSNTLASRQYREGSQSFTEILKGIRQEVVAAYTGDNSFDLAQTLITLSERSTDDYLKASAENFKNIGDLLAKWGSSTFGDLSDATKDILDRVTEFGTSIFGEDVEAFATFFDDLMSQLKIQTKAAQTTAIGTEITSVNTNQINDAVQTLDTGSKSLYQQLKDWLVGYKRQDIVTNADGTTSIVETDVPGLANVLGENGASDMLSTIDSVINSLGIFGDMIMGMNPLIAALKPVIEGFVSVMGPMVEAVLLPLQSTLTYIGELMAGLFAPILDKLAPVFQFVANVLMMVIQPVLALIQAPLQVIAALLTVLTPILNVFGKLMEYLMIPLNAFAATIEWLSAWIRFIILGIYNAFSWIWGGTVENNTPESWQSYYNNLKEKTQWTDVGSVDTASIIAEGMISGSSTSSGVTNASYTGGGTFTMNIYVNAPVVGSAGMEEFAIMLRKEFEAIGYYNVA